MKGAAAGVMGRVVAAAAANRNRPTEDVIRREIILRSATSKSIQQIFLTLAYFLKICICCMFV